MHSTPRSESEHNDSVFDFLQALRRPSTPGSPAGITEALLPEISDSFWLLVTSNAVIDAQDTQALRMILARALPRGVSVALDVNWQPQRWSLPEESPPTAEVLRRFQPLSQAAQLIRCTREEAEAFFGSADPVRVHETLAQRPAVLITGPAGGLDWCIGGRRGHLDPAMLQDHDVFLARLLDNLCSHPQLLGSAGPGIDAVADPDRLAEQLLNAAGCAG